VNASRSLTDPDNYQDSSYYIKNCTAQNPAWDRCMIETLEQDGVIQHYHRGCHDGITFGTQFDSPRFKNLTPTNETVCAHVVVLACYTFCNTDLCNGPQPPEVEQDPCANFTVSDYYYTDTSPYDNPLYALCGASGIDFHRGGVAGVLLMWTVALVVDFWQ